VIAGEQLLIDGRLSPGLTALLKRMTVPQPGDRPSVEEIFGELEADDLLTVRGPTRSGRVRIHMGRSAYPAPDEEPGEEPDEEPDGEPGERGGTGASPSRVRINIRNKDEGATDDSDR
jgi:hypothetical protein